MEVVRSWNLRFHQDFHDWEMEAVSFLDFTYSQIPKGEGDDRMTWRLSGSGSSG